MLLSMFYGHLDGIRNIEPIALYFRDQMQPISGDSPKNASGDGGAGSMQAREQRQP